MHQKASASPRDRVVPLERAIVEKKQAINEVVIFLGENYVMDLCSHSCVIPCQVCMLFPDPYFGVLLHCHCDC